MQTQQTPHSSPPDRHQQDEPIHISREDAFNATFFFAYVLKIFFKKNHDIKNLEVEVLPYTNSFDF